MPPVRRPTSASSAPFAARIRPSASARTPPSKRFSLHPLVHGLILGTSGRKGARTCRAAFHAHDTARCWSGGGPSTPRPCSHPTPTAIHSRLGSRQEWMAWATRSGMRAVRSQAQLWPARPTRLRAAPPRLASAISPRAAAAPSRLHERIGRRPQQQRPWPRWECARTTRSVPGALHMPSLVRPLPSARHLSALPSATSARPFDGCQRRAWPSGASPPTSSRL